MPIKMAKTKPQSLPSQWQLKGNYLAGITFDHWWSLLQQNQFQIAPAYWYRAGAITLTSGLSTIFGWFETQRYEDAIAAVELPADPIFILGHWRSGTTLLHELLALDTEHLAFPNTFETLSPKNFLLAEKFLTRLFAGLLPTQRPMDNMSLGFHLPQEDEFALSLITGQSYYVAFSFPQAESYYERYLTLEDLSLEERQQWQDAFRWLLQKLTFKYRRQLVLKSPPHTARIRLLLELFPQARFVHIHRHPYRVFQSMQHYFATAGWQSYLQKPNLQGIDGGILRRYQILYDAYFEQKDLIPAGQFCDVRFTDLEQDPIQQIQTIYRTLDLPYSEAFDTRLQGYFAARQGYRKNTFPPLDSATKQQIHQTCQRTFSAWGYATEEEG
ncbi:MAG: sulfotransferase [Cyanobacteria bacterium P01_F01_bin.86]